MRSRLLLALATMLGFVATDAVIAPVSEQWDTSASSLASP